MEYSIKQDREGKMAAVSVARAPPGAVVFEVVSEELHRGIVVEKPLPSKQYLATSGVIQYEVALKEGPGPEAQLPGAAPPDGTARAADGGNGTGGTPLAASSPEEPVPAAAPSPPVIRGWGSAPAAASPAPPPATRLAKLVFYTNDVVGSSSSMRPGDQVTFRVATNVAAAHNAAAASVPGAAQHVGRRAVEVALVRANGVVVALNSDRLFGFISFMEEEGGGGEGRKWERRAFFHFNEVRMMGERRGAVLQDSNQLSAHMQACTAIAQGACLLAAWPRSWGGFPALFDGRLFFFFIHAPPIVTPSESRPAPPPHPTHAPTGSLSTQLLGKKSAKVGDEVRFVLHTHARSGDLNARAVKVTKEAPEPSPEEVAAAAAPVPERNPNKPVFTSSSARPAGAHKAARIAKVGWVKSAGCA